MSRVYIAGPMTGYPEYNVPAFKDAALLLRYEGHEVVSPVEIFKIHFGNNTELHPSEYLIKDILDLFTCDTICLLKGWEGSVGAKCEAAIAVTLGMKFRTLTKEIDTPHILIDKGYKRAPA